MHKALEGKRGRENRRKGWGQKEGGLEEKLPIPKLKQLSRVVVNTPK